MSNQVETVLDGIADEKLKLSLRRLFSLAQGEVDAGKADIVILAARRLACIYQLLLQNGMSPITGAEVISDRCLGLEPSDADGVMILDDSVILGSTLDRLVRAVRKRHPRAAISCLTVVRDPKQNAEFFLENLNLTTLEERDAEEIENYSSEIVEILSANLIPFFTDFPVSKQLTFSKQKWLEHLASSNWYAADVTNSPFEDEYRRAIVQIPRHEKLSKFLSSLPAVIADLVEAFKLRSFVREDVDAVDAVSVRLVPIAMMAPCSEEELNICFEHLPEKLVKSRKRTWAALSPESKHRLIQFYVSLRLLAEAWQEASQLLKSPISTWTDLLDEEQIAISIGFADGGIDQFSEILSEHEKTNQDQPYLESLRLNWPSESPLLSDPELSEILFSTRELIASVGIPERPEIGLLSKIGLIFAQAISSLFGYVDRTYERPQRERIAKLPNRRAYDEFIQNHPRVLDQGFTLKDLSTRLLPDPSPSDPWNKCLVSLAIDAGNDLGIIVPVTRYDATRELAYRCYRLGETAYLASTPLVELAAHGNELDRMSLSCQQPGITLRPQQIAVEELFGAQAGSSPDELRSVLYSLIPGRVLSQHSGLVISVDEDNKTFIAELRNLAMGTEIQAEFPWDELSQDDWSELRRGTRFFWYAFESSSPTAKTKSTRLRLRRRAPLDPNVLVAAERAVNRLPREEDT